MIKKQVSMIRVVSSVCLKYEVSKFKYKSSKINGKHIYIVYICNFSTKKPLCPASDISKKTGHTI